MSYRTRKPIKVFVAGSNGFLGKRIMERLAISPRFEVLKNSSKHFDLTNLSESVRATKGADFVVNVAGLVTSRRDQERQPADIFYTNVLIAFQIFEACRRNRIKKVITFSSITGYPASSRRLLKEKLFLRETAPSISGRLGFYGLSRWIVPLVARSYAFQHGIRSRVIIFPNLYGPGDKFGHDEPPLVPNLIFNVYRAKVNKEKIFYAGNNRLQSIDLLYIEDAADAAFRVLEDFGEEPFLCFNAGSGRRVAIGTICKIIAKEIGFDGRIEWEKGQSTPGRYLDNGAIYRRYRWQPKVDTTEGLRATVQWFLNHYVSNIKR